MAEKKKSIIDEAVLDAKRIQETLNANTKEILRSIAKEEIDDLVKESLNEFDEEDVEDTETTDVAVDADAEAPVDGVEDVETDAEINIDDDGEEEMGGSEEDLTVEPVGDMEMGAEAPMGDEMDMTTASDDDVIAVYKKLTGDDEIQIVSNENGDIELTVNEPGEFVIKTNAANSAPTPPAAVPTPIETGLETGEEDGEELELSAGDDLDADLPMTGIEDTESGEEEEEETYDESYDVNESNVVYEIAIDEMENIESVKAPVGSEKSPNNFAGDNLEGGFDDNGQNGTGDAHGEHIMEEEEEVSETKYVGGKVAKVATSHTNQKLETNEYVSKADYDKLLKEAKAIKTKANEMAQTLKEQRVMLGKVVVFNTNLTNVTRLFTEHATTKEEKRTIIERFDEEVSNIQESKRLFKTIEKELINKKSIAESVEGKFSKEKSSSASKLNETTAYVDQGTKRIIDLMSRVDNKDKY